MPEPDAPTSPSYRGIFIRGMAMGAADLVPGVSGGTIALITGIYQPLLNSLASLTPAALKILKQEGLSRFWQHTHANFLLSLMAGILLSVLSLAHIIQWLLATYPVIVWSFFCGLIVAANIDLLKQVSHWNFYRLLFFLSTILLLTTSLTTLPQLSVDSPWQLILGGTLAACAMLLPGISGGFILLLLGLYNEVLQAITEFNMMLLIFLAVGVVIGLLIFARLLSLLLQRYKDTMLSILAGMLTASLFWLWPWRNHDDTSVLATHLLPWNYHVETGQSPSLIGAFLLFLIGFALFHWLARRSQRVT